jgi:hypothetical protein
MYKQLKYQTICELCVFQFHLSSSGKSGEKSLSNYIEEKLHSDIFNITDIY